MLTSDAADLPDFSPVEYETRLDRLRDEMRNAKLDAVLLNSEANLEYFSGFTSPFPWNSPSRALHVLLPLENDPVAVVPELLDSAWRDTSWIKTSVTWPSPRPTDEGLTEIVKVWRSFKRRFGKLGAEIGPESRIGMTVADFLALIDRLRPESIADATMACRAIRSVKSEAEVARIKRACSIASDAFDALPDLIAEGKTEAQVVRGYQAAALKAGADWVPFVAARSGLGGYDSIVTGPSDHVLQHGEVFVLDAGVKYRSYSSDFDRNYALGTVDEETRSLHRLLHRATEAGIAAARPGALARDVYHAQARVLEDGGLKLGRLGRFGHGLGRQLTEPPSHSPDDATPIVPGMVLTIEPAATRRDGLMLVHEENLVVRDAGNELLSRRAPHEIPVIG
jgi:Xaa-Pro aminopeptidase